MLFGLLFGDDVRSSPLTSGAFFSSLERPGLQIETKDMKLCIVTLKSCVFFDLGTFKAALRS